MSEYLLSVIRRDLSVPTPEEFALKLARLKPVALDRPAARDIDEIRTERDIGLDRPTRKRTRRSG